MAAAAQPPSPAEGGSAEGYQELIAGVRDGLQQGDLFQANSLLDAAFLWEHLTREQLQELYVLRALLAYADDRLGLLEESLAALASLLPQGSVEEFPPPMRARFAEVQADATPIELSVEVATEVVDGERMGRAVTDVQHDRGRLVRTVRVLAAEEMGDLRLLGEGDVLSLGDPHEDAVVRYVLEGFGPGNAPVANLGTQHDPLFLSVPAVPRDNTYLYVAIITGASVLVAGAIAFGFAWVLTDGFTDGQATRIDSVSCCSR